MNTHLPSIKQSMVPVVAVMALTACAGATTVSRENIAHSYLPEELYVVATGENELRTVIVGDPFDVPRDAFQSAVLAGLDGQNFGPRLNLSTDPKREDSRKRQVVIAFNLTNIKQADALCAGAAETAKVANTNSGLTVTGVYCAGDHYLTQATARSAAVSGPDSVQFRRLMTQLAIALFPDDNPHRRAVESKPPPVP